MKKHLIITGAILLSLVLHITFHRHLFSLFLAPASIPFILALTNPFPIVIGIFSYLILESFSSLPQGSMILMFLIPYAMRFFWKSAHVDLSWKFFFFTLVTTFFQISALSLFVGPSIVMLPAQILATTASTFLLAFVCHEYTKYV